MRDHWYGWQILIGAGVAEALIVPGIIMTYSKIDGGETLAIAGLVGYAFVGPTIHLVHGHGGKAAGSLGISVGVPAVTGLVGLGIGTAAARGCEGFLCGIKETVNGTIIGVVTGTVVAPFIDAFALAHEQVPDTPNARHSLGPSITAVVPLLGQGRRGLAVAGQF